MDLTKLFETQKVLRDRIGYNEPDRFNKLILALLVELGECANEWRGFKYWSKDQEPRTSEYVLKKEYQHLHISQTSAYEYQLRDEYGNIVFEDVTDDHHDHKNPLLEEYVDGEHFLLELGIELEFKDFECLKESTKANCSVEELLINIYAVATDLLYENGRQTIYIALFMLYNQLGKELGFTWEQIEQAYYEKNQINHKRQEEGY